MSFTLRPRLLLAAVLVVTASGCSGLSGLARTSGYNPYFDPYNMQQARTAQAFADTRAAIEASRNRPVTGGGHSGSGCNMPGAYVTCD